MAKASDLMPGCICSVKKLGVNGLNGDFLYDKQVKVHQIIYMGGGRSAALVDFLDPQITTKMVWCHHLTKPQKTEKKAP